MITISSNKINVISNIFKDSISYFEKVQNPDGGFPYSDEGSPSGLWTTSGVLWALTSISKFPYINCISSALENILSNQNNNGSLPFIKKGDKACIDATAQFILAAVNIYLNTEDDEILKNIERAAIWLCNNSKNGSWGTLENTIPIVSSTSFSLLALNSINEILNNSQIEETILAGVNWLKNLRNDDFGWGIYKGNKSKAGTTALASIAINECMYDELEYKDDIIIKAKEFIITNQLPNGSWLDVIERKAGMTIIRLSTPYCLMSLIASGCKIENIEFQKGFNFLLRSFNNGVIVYQDSDIITWSTRDGLLALSYVQQNTLNDQLLDLFDQNINLSNELESKNNECVKLSNEIKILQESEISKISNTVREKIGHLRKSYNFFRTITITLLFLLLVCIVVIIQNLFKPDTNLLIGIIAIAVAFWTGLTTIIISNKFE